MQCARNDVTLVLPDEKMQKQQVKPPQVFTYTKEWTTHDFYGKYHLSHLKNPHPVPGTQVLLEKEHVEKKKADAERYEAAAKEREELNAKRRALKNESTKVMAIRALLSYVFFVIIVLYM